MMKDLPDLGDDVSAIVLSDKAQCLVTTLQDIYSSSVLESSREVPVVIVFTERRITAYALMSLFEAMNRGIENPVIKPCLLIGHGTQARSLEHTSFLQLAQIVSIP